MGSERRNDQISDQGAEFFFILPEDIRKKGMKILGILIAFSFVFTLIPLLIADPLMHKWYTSAPLIMCLLGDVHLVMGLVLFAKAKEPLGKNDVKKGFERIAIWAFLNSLFSFASLICQIVWHVKNGCMLRDTVITVSTMMLFAVSFVTGRAKGCAEARERR